MLLRALNLTALLLLSHRVMQISATACGSVSNTYCLNERQYISCGPQDPTTTLRLYTCPRSDLFCADVMGTCTADATALISKNTNCGVCSTAIGRGHTCTGYDSFQACLNGERQTAETKFCPKGQYCDAYHPNAENPCSAFTGTQLLCWRDLDVPSTASRDERECEVKGEGRFEVIGDETCRS